MLVILNDTIFFKWYKKFKIRMYLKHKRENISQNNIDNNILTIAWWID